ncbi:DeoR/GlpR family DNA-binding transcription regulator [uncultured Cutibacterium sp.]|uniref:DeoR/GlpR family DNA-binding transcription regulator n=1 Tax=uncultured Cutibacterium sp. TaxID=1912223 RepID=UPI0025957E53|nr:DeoR/GlpR family DNA-binding transcription regulator [uncultured Cutibacterium sp.]
MSTTPRQPRTATATRRRHIVDHLRSVGRSESVGHLSQLFGVSTSTIRRDVDALSDQSKIWKISGGDVMIRRHEPTWHEKEQREHVSKTAMATYAADHLVNEGDLVLLDSGTSTATLGRLLSTRDDITILVGGLSVLHAVAEGTANVMVLGGALRRHSGSLLGPWASSNLRSITPDVAFIGCDAISATEGLNCPLLESVEFKQEAMMRARTSWILADPTKIFMTGTEPYWAPIPPRTGILTAKSSDSELTDKLDAFRRNGHRVIQAPRQPADTD